MTTRQEEQIRMLRAQGVGYRNIGNIVRLSRDTVRNYCKANNLSGHQVAVKANIQRMMEDKSVCSYCGTTLNQNHTGRPKRFCCNDCRIKWWAQNRDKINVSSTAVYEFTCKCCGTTFTAYGNSNRIYCSHECYVNDRFWSVLEEKESDNGCKPFRPKKASVTEFSQFEVRRLS